MKETELSIWVAISKNNQILLFGDEPHRNSEGEDFEWAGNLYVNCSIYERIERLIKQSSLTHQSDPEQLILTVNVK